MSRDPKSLGSGAKGDDVQNKILMEPTTDPFRAQISQRGRVTVADHLVLLATAEQALALDIEPADPKAETKKIQPPVYVEIGTHTAHTSAALLRALAPTRPTRFRSIDIDCDIQGRHRFFPRDRWRQMIRKVESGLCDAGFIEKPAVDAAADVPDPVVWVFCDGCHCSECVEGEISAYAPRIQPGGFLLFHDCGEQYRGYPPDQPYHGDGNRAFAVVEIATTNPYLSENFELVATTPVEAMRGNRLFGGMYVYRKSL
jgi:hypothetical protein